MKNRCITFSAIFFALGFLALPEGAQALNPPPDGGYGGANTAVGDGALDNLVIPFRGQEGGERNTALGFQTLFNLTTADDNTATGYQALFSNTDGYSNTANGYQALYANTTGRENTAMGYRAGQDLAGSENTAVGSDALASSFGDGNTAVGHQASNLISGSGNTAMGDSALFSISGSWNTAVGQMAMAGVAVGSNNTAIGAFALAPGFATGAGNDNVAIGRDALARNQGSNNTAVGNSALFNNVSGDFNTALGYAAGVTITTASNVICIGAGVGQNVGNSCYIGNIFGQTSGDGVPVFVNSVNKLGTVTSSRRFKEKIEPMGNSSKALFSLRPITFHYKQEIDPAGRSHFGLVAEDVEKVNPDLVVCDKEGKPYTVRYDQVNAMLLNEFLKEHRKNEEQAATIAQQQKDLQAIVAQLTARLNEQAEQIQKVSAQIEVTKFATGRIRRGGPAPRVVKNHY
jgi:Chaperone of endosialidase